MHGSVLAVLLALAIANALEPDVIFVKPDGVKLRLKDEPSLLGVKFEVQPIGQVTHTQVISNSVAGAWEFFIPELKVRSGDVIRYKVTAYYEDDVKESEWMAHELDAARHIRSMKRAAHVVFKDDFNGALNKAQYTIDCTAWGGGNGEFQIYVPEDANLYTRSGVFYLRPTLTIDHKDWNHQRLYHGRINLKEKYGYCTQADNWGCDRSAVNGHILNPVLSGKVTTKAAIRYGKVNVRAMIPKGDWIWPAIWMLPRDWHYGGWPRSGEIDIMESRGNTRAADNGGNDHGVGEVSSTLHWGPAYNQNAYGKTHAEKDKNGGDWHGWHLYTLEWYEDHISTYVDNQRILYVPTPGNGFWNYGGFGGANIWANGGRNAPFDQAFQLILNVAVGGGFFPDSFHYDRNRPWNNDDHQYKTFWERRNEWLPTWHGENAAMAIDYVEMIQA